MDAQRAFDPGLQLERTALAWRRTSLALAVAFLAGSRGAASALGTGAGIAGAVGVLAALGCYVGGDHRYRRAHAALTTASMGREEGDRGEVLLPDGRALLAMAGLAVLLTLGGACYVVAGG